MNDPFLVFPELETERLFLRQVGSDDLEEMYEIKSNPMVTHRYCREPHASLIQTEKWIQGVVEDYHDRKLLYWKIINREDGKVAGSITLWNLDLESRVAEIGYELHPDFWKKGIMQETMKCILDWSFRTLDLNRIEACPIQGNNSSVNLLEKAGFKLEGTLKERVYFNERFLDQYYYAVLKKEWFQLTTP